MTAPHLVALACAVFAAGVVHAQEAPAPPAAQESILTDPQVEADCRSYGVAAVFLSHRRQLGMASDEALADVRENFQRLDNSAEPDRISFEFVWPQLAQIAADVYSHPDFTEETVRLSFRNLCLAKRLAPLDAAQVQAFFARMHACQAQHPIDFWRRNSAQGTLQKTTRNHCLESSAAAFMRELGTTRPAEAAPPTKGQPVGAASAQPSVGAVGTTVS